MTIYKDTNISYISTEEKHFDDGSYISVDIKAILMSKISKTKVLTKSQEICLSKRILVGKSYEKLLLNLMKNNKDIPASRLNFIEKRIDLGKKSIKQLTNANLKLVIHFANRFNNKHVDVMDLYQEGFLALYNAASSFDWSYGMKFSTYASYSIRQSFQRFFDKQGCNMPISIHESENIRKMKRVQQESQQDLKRKLTNSELAVRMNVSEAKIDDWQQKDSPEISIEELAENEHGYSSYDLVYEAFSNPETQFLNNAQIGKLLKILNMLSNKEKYVLKNYYGINMDKRKTLSEIGRELNISCESVRRIREKCLLSIRKQFSDISKEMA